MVIVVLPLLVLVVLGGSEVVQQAGVDVHRVGTIHLDGLPRAVLQRAVKLLGVDPLLVGGEEEYPLKYRQPGFVGHPGGDGVAVSGLALPGESPHQVFSGLAVEKGVSFVGHNEPSLTMENVSSVFLKNCEMILKNRWLQFCAFLALWVEQLFYRNIQRISYRNQFFVGNLSVLPFKGRQRRLPDVNAPYL